MTGAGPCGPGLADDQSGTAAGGRDVLKQIEAVDGAPGGARVVEGFVLRDLGVLAEVRGRILERRLAQLAEPVQVPALDVLGPRVDVHAEVEEVGEPHAGPAVLAGEGGLEDVQALDDEDVRAPHGQPLARHDVVLQMRVDGRGHLVLAGLDVGDEAGQCPAVVRLRKALPRHQPARPQLLHRQQEPVGGHAFHARVLGPAGEQRLEEPRDGRLADGHAPGDPYDEGRAALGAVAVAGVPEEGVECAAELAGGLHIQVEQPGDRQIDVPHLIQIDDVPEPTQPLDLLGAERQGRLVPQRAPLGAAEVDEGGRPVLGAPLDAP